MKHGYSKYKYASLLYYPKTAIVALLYAAKKYIHRSSISQFFAVTLVTSLAVCDSVSSSLI